MHWLLGSLLLNYSSLLARIYIAPSVWILYTNFILGLLLSFPTFFLISTFVFPLKYLYKSTYILFCRGNTDADLYLFSLQNIFNLNSRQHLKLGSFYMKIQISIFFLKIEVHQHWSRVCSFLQVGQMLSRAVILLTCCYILKSREVFQSSSHQGSPCLLHLFISAWLLLALEFVASVL